MMGMARWTLAVTAAVLVACGGAEGPGEDAALPEQPALEDSVLPPEPPGDAGAPPPVDDGFANRPPDMGPLPEESLRDSARQGPIFEIPAAADTADAAR